MKKIPEWSGKIVWNDELTDGKEYQRFLRVALNYADRICLSFDGGWKDFMASDWAFLATSAVDHEITSHSPVTVGPTVLLLYLKIDHMTVEWLKGKRHIYDFQSTDSDCPEDLCLLKNGMLVFCSCTHERFCYMNEELAALLR